MNKTSSTHPAIRKVLVTGALGKIGRQILPNLAAKYTVIPTDLAKSNIPNYVQADLTDFEATLRLMQGIDAVVHLAVATGEGRSNTNPPHILDPVDVRMLAVNPMSVHHVLEAAARAGVQRVVYISSLTIVLSDVEKASYPADMPPEPTGLYACTKLFGEQLAWVKWKRNGLSTICLRIGQPTPVDVSMDHLWKANRRARSFRVHMVDLIAGIETALQTPTAYGVYNIVSSSDNQRVDITPARRDLGYTPRAFFGDNFLTIDGMTAEIE